MRIYISKRAACAEASRLEILASKRGYTTGRSSGHRFQQYKIVPFLFVLWRVVER